MGPRATNPTETMQPEDLATRDFVAPRPNDLGVADIASVHSFSGRVHDALVTDVSSRPVVSWQVSTRLSTASALDASKMSMWRRQHAR